MADERLLERIGRMETSPGGRVERSLSKKIDSIVDHLQRVLNTRQGSVPIADDFGIPDITNTTGEGIDEMTERIERNIQHAIMKYEPRLGKVRVHLTSEHDDVLTLRFKLDGVLVTENNTPVLFETIVSAEGKVNVRSSRGD